MAYSPPLSLMIIAVFHRRFRVFFSKFTKTPDISYDIENFKAKISNVHDDKHLRIKMSTSRGHAKDKHEQTIKTIIPLLQ